MKVHPGDEAMVRSYNATIQPTFWVREREGERERVTRASSAGTTK